jgi:hypothetical protein
MIEISSYQVAIDYRTFKKYAKEKAPPEQRL